MESLKTLYYMMRADRRKERYEMILEPFQALVQLAMLSFCPVGSRLAISSNLLSIQTPSFTTSITRSYYQDCREDLVYLFSVITRFRLFYGHMEKAGGDSERLYSLLVLLGRQGLEKIIQTYTNTGHGSLIQQLKMYRAMLDRPEAEWHRHEPDTSGGGEPRDDIDGVFIHIRELYSTAHMAIVLNALELMQESPGDYISYMSAIDSSMRPVCLRVQKWIHQNIIL